MLEFGSTHLTIFCPLDNIGSSKLKNTIRVEISRTDDKIGNRMESSRKNWGPIKKTERRTSTLLEMVVLCIKSSHDMFLCISFFL